MSSANETEAAAEATGSDGATAEIAPLLIDVEAAPTKPRISIFSVSKSKSRASNNNKDILSKATDSGESFLNDLFLWAWDGSRFSGMICMALASTIYWIMEIFITTFTGPKHQIISVKQIPLFEIVFTRCTVISILSFMWLRRTGQPTLGPMNTRLILLSRALVGYLSLSCFIYSVQNLPLHYAIMANFASPLVASFAARLISEEKMDLSDIGNLACSFLGIAFLYHQPFAKEGALTKTGEVPAIPKGGDNFAGSLFVGILSSFLGGVSYCLVKSGAKATDQPVLTVFVFTAFACPLSAICSFLFEKLTLLDLYSLLITVVLGILGFFAEVFVARGLQLEKISKATNILYLKAFLTEVSSMTFFRETPSFSRLVGCVLLVISICSTVYFGPKEIN